MADENNKTAKFSLKTLSPVKIALLIGALLLAGFCCWRFANLDADSDEDTQPAQNGAQKRDFRSIYSSHKDEPGNELSTVSKTNLPARSRLLDMAETRQQQMDKVEDKFNKKVSSDITAPLKLGTDIGIDSAKVSRRTVQEIEKDLEQETKRFGTDHPFPIDTSIELALAMERDNTDSTELILATARSWTRFVKLVKTKDKNMDKLVRIVGLPFICKWTHDSGEILAMMLWAKQQNSAALKIAKEIPSVDLFPKYALTDLMVCNHRLLTLARLLASQNEYVEAKKVIALAKSMALKFPDLVLLNQNYTVAMCLLEESRLSYAQRDYDEAARLAADALARIEKSVNMQILQKSASMADALEQLARAEAANPSKISTAIANQEKCLSLRKSNFGKDGVYTLSTTINLARMLKTRLIMQGENGGREFLDPAGADARRVMELLQDTISACRKQQPSDSEVLRSERNFALLLPQAYFELGSFLSYCGKFKEARAEIQKAADIDMSNPEPSVIPYKVADYDALATLDLKEGQVAAARNNVLKASSILQDYVANILPQLSLSEQVAFSASIEAHMNSLLSVCSDDSSLSAPYGEMIKWKGFLVELFRLRSRLIKEKSPEMGKMLASHQRLSREILTSYIQPDNSSSNLKNENQSRKEELERRINSQLRGRLKESLAFTPALLQNKLRENEVFVDLYVFSRYPWEQQPHYGAIVGDKKSLRWIDLGASDKINKAIASWRSYDNMRAAIPSLQDAEAGKIEAEQKPFQLLKTLLADPLSKAIPEGKSRLWICDEGELSRLPWSLILSDFTCKRSFEVCQLDSPRELLVLSALPAVRKSRHDVLIVGGIDFSKHVPPAPPLKNALIEVQEIKGEMESKKASCIVQSDMIKATRPTRENIMSAMSKSQVAHLVTHGFYNNKDEASADDRSAMMRFGKAGATRAIGFSDETEFSSRNPLVESGLLISTNGSAQSGESGFLTAEDLLDADLDGCRLVTLSACDTGRGREVNSQGVLGLRSALMGGGSRCVLLSLWPVSDLPTSLLMKRFYQSLLEGKSPVVALKEGQAEVRSKLAAPYFWAAWILVGDGWESITVGK